MAMLDAEYHHVFEVGSSPEPGKDSGPIDLTGIALTRGKLIKDILNFEIEKTWNPR